MIEFFKQYVWREGIPRGTGKLAIEEAQETISYKIVMDPYRKRISLEKYHAGQFSSVIYDSLLLDFRHLKPVEQAIWQRTLIEEQPDKTVHLIRNQDDRAIYYEISYYEDNECSLCQVTSIHGIPLSSHRTYRISAGATFNGVILFDTNDIPVMYKLYEIDEVGAFTQVIEEQWDMEKKQPPLIAAQKNA